MVKSTNHFPLLDFSENYVKIKLNKLRRGGTMKQYKLTVFEKNGEKLLDETFEAANDQEAKQKGEQLLKEKGYKEKTYRCTSPAGKLLLFHV